MIYYACELFSIAGCVNGFGLRMLWLYNLSSVGVRGNERGRGVMTMHAVAIGNISSSNDDKCVWRLYGSGLKLTYPHSFVCAVWNENMPLRINMHTDVQQTADGRVSWGSSVSSLQVAKRGSGYRSRFRNSRVQISNKQLCGPKSMNRFVSEKNVISLSVLYLTI